MADSLENFGQLSKSSRTLSRSGSSWIKHETAAREFPAELAGKAVMELSISCSNLPKMDFFGLSDPFVVMYVTGLNNEKKVMKMGQTETIWFCLDPSFVKVFDLPLDTPKDAVLKCELYDRDGPTDQLTRHDYMGTVKVKFEELLGAKGGQLEKNIVNEDTRKVNKVQPTLTYYTTKLRVPARPNRWQFQFGLSSGTKQPKKGTKWFYELRRSNEEPAAGKAVTFPHVLYRSEPVSADRNYVFDEVTIPVERVQINGQDRILRLDLFEYKKKGGHIPIAFFEEPFSHVLGFSAGKKMDLTTRKGTVIGSCLCSKSLKGEDHNGKLFNTVIQIDSLSYD